MSINNYHSIYVSRYVHYIGNYKNHYLGYLHIKFLDTVTNRMMSLNDPISPNIVPMYEWSPTNHKTTNRYGVIASTVDGHANGLLIDNLKKIIIRYEPHGGSFRPEQGESGSPWNQYMDNGFRKFVSEQYGGYIYQSADYLYGHRLALGPQKHINNDSPYAPSCAIWCMWSLGHWVNTGKIPAVHNGDVLVKKLYKKLLHGKKLS